MELRQDRQDLSGPSPSSNPEPTLRLPNSKGIPKQESFLSLFPESVLAVKASYPLVANTDPTALTDRWDPLLARARMAWGRGETHACCLLSMHDQCFPRPAVLIARSLLSSDFKAVG